MARKKILIFSLAYHPFVGGAEVAIKEITDRISSEQFEFHMITSLLDSALPKEEQVGNVLVHRVGWGKKGTSVSKSYGPFFFLTKAFFVPCAALKAVVLHKKYAYDGVWAMMTYMLFPIVLLRLLRVCLPYLLTLQEGDPFQHVFGRIHILPFRPLISWGFRHASAVSAISTYLGAWAKRVGFPGTPRIVPNGVAVGLFSREYPQMSIDMVKNELGKKMGDVFLITTSRLVYKNAIDDVIRALALLLENVHFIVLGEGPEEKKLKHLAETTGVFGRVTFLGHVDYAEIPKYLKASDIFIRPSRSEGMGNSFIEAMAAVLPIVATQEGGIADFLFDEKKNPDKPITGWAVGKNSPEDIARVVRSIMDNQEKVRAVTRTAKELVREKYDWDVVVGDMEVIFEKIATARR